MAAMVISVVSPCIVTPSLKIEKPPEKIGWLCATAARQTEIDNLLLIIKFYQPIYFVEYFCRTANIYNTDSCQSTFYKAYLACC